MNVKNNFIGEASRVSFLDRKSDEQMLTQVDLCLLKHASAQDSGSILGVSINILLLSAYGTDSYIRFPRYNTPL